MTQPPATGARLTIRGEDFLVKDVKPYKQHHLIKGEGISELVLGQEYIFDTQLDTFQVLAPENTTLVADTEGGYRKTRLYLETQLRNAFTTSKQITIADRGALDLAAYQLTPTIKALDLPRARLLIADGVGLGKTIEVGILLAELMKRGRGKRVLVLALKSILAQFQQEIWNRFAIPLVRLDSYGVAQVQSKLPADKNPFEYFDKTIISIDTLKNGQFKHYIEKSKWDVIVIDECHTVANGGSQRGALAKLLSRQCDSLILTSATPHNGKRENFANLMTMLEPIAVPRSGEFTRETIDKYFVRRFKNDIEDEGVKSNFKERSVEPIRTALNPAEEEFLAWQQTLKAQEIAANADGKLAFHRFFSIILFKAYLSSPTAAKETLERKLDKLSGALEDEGNESIFDGLNDQHDQLQEGLNLVNLVLETKTDSKLNAFVNLLKNIGWKGRANDERIVVFAERIATLAYLEEQLTAAFKLKAKAVQRFDGSLLDTQQQDVIEEFGTEDSPIRLFLTSDAGAQGVNLHYFCHRMVNYDLPWSIITLDQRNGRIDRYGQQQTPIIHYLLAETNTTGLKSDLHILENIKTKEEEVEKTLGAVGTVLGLFETKAEENQTGIAMIQGDDSYLTDKAQSTQDDSADPFDALLAELEAGTPATERPEDYLDEDVSFYPNDFAYYKELLEFLQQENVVNTNEIVIREDLIEVKTSDEMRYLLEGMPREAKPKKDELFQLTTDKKVVMKAIAKAREKKDTWAQFQLLYDLHPLAKFWMTKLEARIEKGQALVAKVNQLPAGHRSFVFHGQVTNKQGNNVLSDFFVLTLGEDGRVVGDDSLEDYLAKYKMTERLFTQKVTASEIETLQKDMLDAIEFAKNVHMMSKQASLKRKMDYQREEYQKDIDRWFNAGQDSLGLTENDIPDQSDQSIQSEKSTFYDNLTSLGNQPYLKVLAVFLAAD
jgi:ERCC4-related helicase